MRFQAPKGTRDFYPAEMAVRRRLEGAWREASTCFGYEEVDGPTFEHLGLYTAKSGEGIVSELFSFRRASGSDDYALRPEFTPTLARMVAARAAQLPMPVKWFAVPNFFRAERPQRGRLREFFQWNVDLLGAEGPAVDAEVIGVAVSALSRLGLTPERGGALARFEQVARDRHAGADGLREARERVAGKPVRGGALGDLLGRHLVAAVEELERGGHRLLGHAEGAHHARRGHAVAHLDAPVRGGGPQARERRHRHAQHRGGDRRARGAAG
ncbi:MAG: ATP phosphoribosyltransferase regulatory subunit, partial [Phycisphaerales bacterium]